MAKILSSARSSRQLVLIILMGLVSALLVVGLRSPASAVPASSDSSKVDTLCGSSTIDGLSASDGYFGAFLPHGATIHFYASGTLTPELYFAGYWRAEYYLYAYVKDAGTTVFTGSALASDYTQSPDAYPFSNINLGSWTNSSTDKSVLVDLAAYKHVWGLGISWNVRVAIDYGPGAVNPGCRQLVPAMPLGQTFGGQCDCVGGATAYQHLTSRPVNTATGGLYEQFTDLALPGAGRQLDVVRSYNSLDSTSGPLGPGWTFGLNASLSVDAASGDVTVRAEDGKQAVYTNANGVYLAPPGVRSQLTAVAGGGYLVTAPDQSTLAFTPGGQLTAAKDRLGIGLTLAYSGGKLASITDAAGRQATVSFTGDRISRIALSDGRHVDYGYTNGLLTSVTDRRGKVTTYAYDAGGRLVSAVDPDAHSLFRNTYDASTGRVVSQLDGRGKQTTFGWDPVAEKATVTDPRGNVWGYTYQHNVLLSSTDPLGDVTRYGYDDRLNRTQVTDPRGNVTTFAFDSSGNLLSRTGPGPSSVQETWTYTPFNAVATHTDGRGKTTTYEYFANQMLKKKTDPLGRVTSYAWTASGLPDTVTDPRGKVTRFGYAAAADLTSVTSPEGNQTTYGYDGFGRKTSMVEPRGNLSGADSSLYTTTWSYNENDQVTSVTDPLGRTTTEAYDNAGNLTGLTDSDQKTTAYAYNEDNQVTQVTDPRGGQVLTTYDDAGNVASVTTPGGKTTFGYDAADRQISETTPRGNTTGADPAPFTWTSTYDANGNRLTDANPTAGTTTTTYDELNRPVTVTDAQGNTTRTAFDADGNVLSVTDPLNRVTAFGYDDADQQTSMTDPTSKVTRYGYDGLGERTSVTTPLGNLTTWTYDGDGRLISRVEPRGNLAGATPSQYATTFGYDAAGHRTSTTDPLGNVTRYAYDRVGNLTSRTDARNNTTSYAYDVLDRLHSVTDALGAATSYGYDATGDLTSRTDPNNHTVTYGYDLAGRLTTKTTPVGTWNYTYDAAGNLTGTETAAGAATPTTGDATITRSYDSLDRLTKIDYSDSTPDVSYAYDELHRTSMTDNAVGGAGTENYTYDAAGQLTGVTRGSTGYGYSYDADGRLTTRTVPDGRTISQTWDDDSRPSGVTAGGASTAYTYDAAGNRTGTTFGNGVTEARTYDKAGRLTALNTAKGTTVVSTAALTLDGNGNPTTVARTYPGGQGETYTYDADNRVTSVCWAVNCVAGLTGSTTYTYDAVGNRLTSKLVGGTWPGTTSYSYNTADQLTKTYRPAYGLNAAVTTNYTYDPNGNQITAGSTSFSYDLANRLTTATVGSSATSYTYDGNNNRIKALTGTAATTYKWDLNNPLPELTSDSTSAGTRTYLDDPAGDPIEITTPGTGTGAGVQYLHPNGLGSISAATDSTGTRQAAYNYDPFGIARPSPTNQDNVNNPVRYAGEYLDPATGRYNLRARDYDPATGRFTALDPVAQDITDPYVSEYLYAGDRPTVFADPSGMVSTGTSIAIAVAVLGTAACFIIEPCGLAVGTAALSGAAIGALGDFGIQVLGNVLNHCDPFHQISWGEVAAWGVIGGLSGGLGALKWARTAEELAANAGTRAALPSSRGAARLIQGAKPTGSALKSDAWHRAAAFTTDDIAKNGTVFRTVGGDGVERLLVQMPGEVNGIAGRFEWIVDGGSLTHQMFVRGGTLNGIPIKP